MNESARIAIAIQRTVTGPVWHGTPLAELLHGVSAVDASARPIAGAHTIWELVLHLTAWARIVEQRVPLLPVPEATDAEDWPAMPASPTPRAWNATLARLGEAHESLARRTAALDPSALDRRVPSRDYTLRDMLHGVPEHGAYHGGQIALLRRAR
ncbi:MAG: DinB family protein [Gemmatimonadota bacterium]